MAELAYEARERLRYSAEVSPPPASSSLAPSVPSRSDELVRTITADGSVTIRTLIATRLVAEAHSRRRLSPTATSALGRALMGERLV